MAINRAGTAGEPGYALLIAAGPRGKNGRQRIMDAGAVLPQLAAVAPAVLAGTPAGASVVQLVDPDEPQTVLTHLRTAAAHPGPVLVYLAGQLTLDAKQRLPHLALARTTPRTARYTALPWHWLAAELAKRPPGSETTVVADLVADGTVWPQGSGDRADGKGAGASRLGVDPRQLAAGLTLYGALAPAPPKREVFTPVYSRALAAALRGAADRPPFARLHEHAAGEAGLSGGPALPLQPANHGAPSYRAEGLATPEAVATPVGAAATSAGSAAPQGRPTLEGPVAPRVETGPAADVSSAPSGDAAFAPGGTFASGRTFAPEAGAAPGSGPAPEAGFGPEPGSAAEAISASRAEVEALGESTAGPRAEVAVAGDPAAGPRGEAGATEEPAVPRADAGYAGEPAAGLRAEAGFAEESVTGPRADGDVGWSDSESLPPPVGPPLLFVPPPAVPVPPLPAAFPAAPPAPAAPPVPVVPPRVARRSEPHHSDPHAAILEAARAGRHSEAASMAAAWEQEAMRASGPSSPEAVHWLEVRADLARLADDPARACELWISAAGLRLANEQPPGHPDVEGAADRAHHQWQQIEDAARAGALAPALIELRGRVPGRRPGALEAVRRRATLLGAGGPG
ncbi:hypothetical protein LRS74_14700 [Streptomyces sp. LX-29]|uniref:hypothetical protein n=1 Tax=Streptomyces sp. LX-29 TaxID=2900152 RepID=UPI00240D78E6|nr:hypothetical protein [Streptomyces sp. LX-29]WFB11980.1 hypothetical protein LRS74_14700 [Streptomyces sp. LX-29]